MEIDRHEEKIPGAPTFKGRLKAQSPQPLGGSRRWADSGFPRDIPDSRFTQSRAATPDIRGFDIPDDDEADFDSGDGAFDTEYFEDDIDTW